MSFGIGGKVLVFGEHQSTVNENMPLRSLLYLGRAYEQIVSVKDRYRRKMVKIPKPEIYTFYNGKEKWEKEKTLKLSNAFMVQDEEPDVELKVKVININPVEKHEILERCRVLKEYSIFIDTIRKYQDADVDEPYRKAIEECIEKDILADYLRKKGSEVVNMLMSEYNYEQDIEVQREEAYEEGKKSGLAEGRLEGEIALARVIQFLIDHNRFDDLKRVGEDSDYRKVLLEEICGE